MDVLNVFSLTKDKRLELMEMAIGCRANILVDEGQGYRADSYKGFEIFPALAGGREEDDVLDVRLRVNLAYKPDVCTSWPDGI